MATQVSDAHDLIRQRALAFAEATHWENAVIIAEDNADPEVVRLRGSGDVSAYRRFRIEIQMRPERRTQLVRLANRDGHDPADMDCLLDGPWMLDVTCSATDVIKADWPYIN